MSKRKAPNGQMAASTSPEFTAHTEQRGWNWAHAALCSDQAGKKCTVKMADSVIILQQTSGALTNSRRLLWLFTQKNGTVTRKKTRDTVTGDVPIGHIRERFVSFASRWSTRQERPDIQSPPYLAVLCFANGSRQLVEPADFQDVLESLGRTSSTEEVERKDINLLGFYAFVPSEGDVPNFIRVLYDSSRGIEVQRCDGYFQAQDCVPSKIQIPAHLRTEVDTAVSAVVDRLNRNANGERIHGIEMEFIIDIERKLWLIHLDHVTIKFDHGRITDGIDSTPRSQSLPNLLETNAQSNQIDSAPVSKCRGEFCLCTPSSLLGLYPRFGRDEESGNQDGGYANVIPDTGARMKMGNSNLLLAHAELDFIVGKVSGSDTKLLALRWQEADNVFRMELGRTNPTQFYKQVSVCLNCHRFYLELSKLRENGFLHQRFSNSKKDSSVMMQQAKRRGVKGKKETMAASASKSSKLMDPSTEYYDQMFLAELERHSNPGDDIYDVDEVMSSNDLPPGRPGSSNTMRTNDRLPLPVLNTSSSSKPLKKLGSSASASNVIQNLTQSNNNCSSNPIQVVQSWNVDREDDSARRTSSSIAAIREDSAQIKALLIQAEAQKQQLEQKLLRVQAQCATILDEKDAQQRKKLLEMEMIFHTKQSQLQQQQRKSGSPSASSSVEEMTKLIETIDSLNMQLDRANQEKEDFTKQLGQRHHVEIKRVHEEYQREMEILRLSDHNAKEQVEAMQTEMVNLQNQLQIASTQFKSAKLALDDLTKNKVTVLEEKNRRLERQVAELTGNTDNQSKPGAKLSMQIIASSSNQGKNMEALEKNLTNKIDYLKAQLASEMKCKEELGNHLMNITNAMEALKKEKKQALLDQEESFKRQMERTDTKFTQDKEMFASQQAGLNSKVMTLQANVTDLVQELTMWKSKEANARLSMEKLAEENVRLNRQVVDLEDQVDSLQEERKNGNGNISAKLASEETNRMQMEALMRRLDNERQYLKNQLDNEADMKDSNQKQVVLLQDQVDQLKARLEQAAVEAERNLSAVVAEKHSGERQLQDTITCLDEGKNLLARQLKEVQAKFAQSREQCLLQRDELEKARIEMNNMERQILMAKDELLKEKEYGKNATERMSKTFATVKSTLQSVEAEKNLRIQHLEDENGLYMKKLADLHGEMFMLEEKWLAEKMRAKKQHALAGLAFILRETCRAWRIRQQNRAFTRLAILHSTCSLKDSIRKAHNSEMEEFDDRLRQEFMDKCDQMTQSLHDERMEAIKSMKDTHDKDREELKQFYEQEKSQVEEELTAYHKKQLQELQEQYTIASQALNSNASDSLQEMQRKYNDLAREQDEVLQELREVQDQRDDIENTLESERNDAKIALTAKEQSWSQEKADIQADFQAQLKATRADSNTRLEYAEKEYSREMALQKQIMEESVRKVVDDANLQAQARMNEAEEIHRQQMASTAADYQAHLQEEIDLTNTRWQQKIDDLRESADQNLKTALERVGTEAKGELEALQQEMNDRKAHAVIQCTAKWQKALEDLQERLELESKLAYEKGVQDRESDWQQAATQIKQKQKEELERVQSEARRAIQAAEERHRLKFQAELETFTQALEKRHREDVEVLTRQITEKEQQFAQEELERKLNESRQEYEVNLNNELIRIRRALDQEHKAIEAKLKADFAQDKQELAENSEREGEQKLVELEQQWIERLDELSATKEAELKVALEKARTAMSDTYDEVARQMQEALRLEMEARLKEQEAQLQSEQEEAILHVQDDSEKLIEQVEIAMTELKRQKEGMEQELLRLRSALEEAEDSHFDVEENLKRQQKSMSFQILVMLMHSRRRHDEAKREQARLAMDLQGKVDDKENALTRATCAHGHEIAQVQATWARMQEIHQEMLQTLTNYKRDELVAHRSASAVVSNEITIVGKQIDEVQEMQRAVEKDIEQLQAEAQTVEASLRQLMVPGGSTSSLSMAVVAKKRRLNEEFESLVEQIEKKKAEARNCEQTAASLRTRREAKENELKVMERKLVEILVQQQKLMLTLLTSVKKMTIPISSDAPPAVVASS